MLYYYLEKPRNVYSNSYNNDDTLFLIILLIIIGFIIVHVVKRCRRNENFMDQEQYTEMIQSMNEANKKAMHGYTVPQLNSCNY
jgi:hypothetical protein